MKVLVTGAAGQLGHDVINELLRRGHEAIGTDIIESAELKCSYICMDIGEAEVIQQAIEREKPDAVIHCAAWTAVDAAEEPENRDMVYRVNVNGTENIAKACRLTGCRMMYISTDYVFDGKGEAAWQPDCKDYAPLNLYGQTKLEGELAVSGMLDNYFIVRIAWVFGKNGKNFIRSMLTAGKNHDKLTVVTDQVGTPTYTFDLARLLVDMIETEKYGYYHVTNEGGYISWYEFAKEIFRQAEQLGYTEYSQENLTVVPVTTAEYGISRAVRPFNSRLDKTKLVEQGFIPLPTWQDALSRYLQEISL